MRDTTDTPCTCWVDRASDELRYQIRYGAHAKTCPTYRESGDAVDRQYDNLARLEGQIADFASDAAAQTYYEVVSVQPTVTGMSESVVRISQHTSQAEADEAASQHRTKTNDARVQRARGTGWIKRQTVVWPLSWQIPANLYREDYPL